jgi:thermolysin
MRHKIFVVSKSFLDSRFSNIRAIGKANLNPRVKEATNKIFEDQLMELQAYFESEIRKGNLRIRLVQDDPEAMMEHHRYSQFYKDLEVFGGEVIQHYREGKLVGINGEYYEIGDFDTTPLITKAMAVEFFKAELGKINLAEKAEESRLVIYPVKDEDYHLAYHIVLREKVGYSMTGIIDAKSGEVLLKYSNVMTDDITIGLGIGYHGESHKFPTTFSNDLYLLYDNKKVRPVTLATYDYRTNDGKYYYLGRDADNYWDYDGALVNAHAYLGFTYDYFYLVHNRKGIDANNMDIEATVHWYDPYIGYDNAYWDPDEECMFFLDPGKRNMQVAAAIDAVAHEYSHGVTQFTSNLVYFWESGALNEAFSDIIGTAVEFYWQPSGNGFNKADWVMGEDEKPYFSTIECRNFADPNSNSQMKNAGYPPSLWYPDPCHLTQEMPIIFYYGSLVDNGGVHINSTIYSHAYYLLANGGTNKVSKIAVTGIGIEKATKIFYRAWTYWMTSTSSFWNAANYLLWSAYDLYGSSSNEYAQTIKAMEAIGWIVE